VFSSFFCVMGGISRVTHMTHICFALVCKLVVKIQISFILFTYMGELDGQNTRGKLLFLI